MYGFVLNGIFFVTSLAKNKLNKNIKKIPKKKIIAKIYWLWKNNCKNVLIVENFIGTLGVGHQDLNLIFIFM